MTHGSQANHSTSEFWMLVKCNIQMSKSIKYIPIIVSNDTLVRFILFTFKLSKIQ